MASMEVDSGNVSKFLAEQQASAPEELRRYYHDFEDLYDRKLWHQLTTRVEEFVNIPSSGPYLVPLYQNFLTDWEDKINKLKLVQFGLAAATQFEDVSSSVDFLTRLMEKVNAPESQDAYVQAKIETAHWQLLMGKVEETKTAMDECDKLLDGFTTVETVIYASFYRVCAEYYKAKAEYAQYYKNALLYLACVNIDDLTVAEKEERAYDLSISALLGDTIYNFGELLMHPILDSLNNTEHEWLRSLLFAFNSGDIGKFEGLASHFSKQSLLESNMAALSRKICLMSLIEAVFKRSADDRNIPFADIATETRLPVEEVEHLVMKALSLKLIKGSIDQVAQVVHVTWVQPRVLDKDQIDAMRQRLQTWDESVRKMALFVQEEGGEVFA
ncbi:hypothetical protein BZG36_02910 [Bifiguratus adelaidae]|uniref:PCI domain-containing protein n=1 Tax=Bifiguratus adelaidae TaxID=1938954 RepID=A0A261Y1C8_9FUNG|nr:hypothetical protein BZG36_02910 [Bifiguratus adelaidae]